MQQLAFLLESSGIRYATCGCRRRTAPVPARAPVSAAELLGVSRDGLAHALTTRTRQTPEGPIISPLSVQAATENRDSLAKASPGGGGGGSCWPVWSAACNRHRCGTPFQQLCGALVRCTGPRGQRGPKLMLRSSPPGAVQIIYAKMFDWLVAAINNAIGEDKVGPRLVAPAPLQRSCAPLGASPRNSMRGGRSCRARSPGGAHPQPYPPPAALPELRGQRGRPGHLRL
jgi:hypothetical protein